MMDFFFTEMHLWILFTAIIFTFVGRNQMYRNIKVEAANLIGETVESTIDNLIKEGYIKTRIDQNGEVEILKYNEK